MFLKRFSSHSISFDMHITVVKDLKLWSQHSNINKNYITKVIKYVINNEQLNEIEIFLTSDHTMHELNKKYRGKDKPTDVLSFTSIGVCNYTIGLIALGYETIEQQSQHITFHARFTHLLIHGLLHILGHEHDTEHGAAIMESLEIKMLEQFNIPSPY